MKRYIRASFDPSIPDWLKKASYAIKALNTAGVDLQHAVFSRQKSGKMEDNFVIYLIGRPGYDIIWIPGVYNDETYISYNDGYSRKDKYKAIKYVPKKYLNIIDTVYVSVSDIKEPKEHYEDPRNFANNAWRNPGKYAGQQLDHNGEWVTPEGRDKSGYEIPDPRERLKKFHNSPEGLSKRGKEIAEKLPKLYEQLQDAKEGLFNGTIIPETSAEARLYRDAYSYLGDALYDYERALQTLDQINRYGGEMDEWSARDLEQDISSCEHNLNRLTGAIDQLLQ